MRSAEGIDAELVLITPPRDDKAVLQIDRLSPLKDRYRVFLTLALNSRYESEEQATKLYAPEDHRIDLDYIVSINLDAMRDEIHAQLQALYGPPDTDFSRSVRAERLVRIPDNVMRTAFSPVAAIGRSVFRQLFESMSRFDNHQLLDTPFLKTVIASVLARPNILVVRSKVRLFPWTFLYDDPCFNSNNRSSFDPTGFWGFKHQIQEELQETAQRILIERPAELVAAVCPSVDPEFEHSQGPFAEKSSREHLIAVRWIEGAEELCAELSDFTADLLYFNGHAKQSLVPTKTTSQLLLGKVPLTVEQIEGGAGLRLHKNPVLAFLNGCETAPLHKWDPNSFAGFLCFAGDHRVCCITTVAQIPIAFARSFGIEFWLVFLKGNTVGAALRAARRTMLNMFANPLGLLYTVFGKVETRLA
jgi:hypothetical protein